MSHALEAAPYVPPGDLEDLADRELEKGKRLILYVGETAIADVVSKAYEVGDVTEPERLILRIEGVPTDKAMDLFAHPSVYTDPETAQQVFGGKQAA